MVASSRTLLTFDDPQGSASEKQVMIRAGAGDGATVAILSKWHSIDSDSKKHKNKVEACSRLNRLGGKY